MKEPRDWRPVVSLRRVPCVVCTGRVWRCWSPLYEKGDRMYPSIWDVVRPFEDRRKRPAFPGGHVGTEVVRVREVAAQHPPKFVAALLNLNPPPDSLRGETWTMPAYATAV